MATNFPGSLDVLTNPTATDTLASPPHADQHANANDAIEALQAKVGVDSSAVTSSLDYKIGQLQAVPAVTIGASTTLSSERALTAGNGITISDGGAGSTVTVTNGLSGIFFGDGSDGDVTITANTQLVANRFYNNLTVNSGVSLKTSGYLVFVAGTLTLNGTIENDGYPNWNNATARVGGEAASVGGGQTGTAGTTAAGTGPGAFADSISANGGAGGSGGSGSGGSGGTTSVPTALRLATKTPMALIVPGIWTGGSFIGTRHNGGAAGGAGAGDGTNAGGNGGGGGGVCVVWARQLAGTGTIAARGGAGFQPSAGNTGGGGGGGGGIVVFVTTHASNPFTVTAAGGAGGLGRGTGTTGTAGSTGITTIMVGV